MATAGYDPRAALDLWELMSCVEEDAAVMGKTASVQHKLSFLRTHPTSEDRMKMLEKDMEGALRTWRERIPERLRQEQRSKEAEKRAVEMTERSAQDTREAPVEKPIPGNSFDPVVEGLDAGRQV